MYSQEQLDQIKVDNDARMASFQNKGKQDTPDTTGNAEYMNMLQKYALNNMDISSSAMTGIDQVVSDSVKAYQDSQKAGASRITGDYGEKITNIQEEGARAMVSAQERRGSIGFNPAALKQLSADTDKQVKEYERMEQDALMQNNTQFASQISNLKLQSIQFKQQAQQQSFSNMMQVAGLGIQLRSEDRAASQFQQNLQLQRDQIVSGQQSDMLSLAANAGVTLTPGETFESLSKKIANSDLTTLMKQKLRNEIANLQEKHGSSINDLYAQQIITEGISAGQTVANTINEALIKVKEIAGRDLTVEESNRVVQMAILAKQQFDDAVAQDVNDTAKNQKDIEFSFDKWLKQLQLKQSLSTVGDVDVSTIPESLGGKPTQGDSNLPYGGQKLGEDIYNNLFGSI